MRLSKLKIKNFKCFGPRIEEIKFESHTIFIGANSTGKTATLLALLRIFGKGQETEITKNDFHIPVITKEESHKELDFSIEVFIEFPELEKEEIDTTGSVPIYF